MKGTLLVTAIVVVAVFSPLLQPAASAGEETHCVVDVVGEKDDGELVVSEQRCYAAFADAMNDASGGTLVLPRNTSGTIMFQDSGVAAAASSFTLGIHYDAASGGGSSISIVGTSCSGGWWNTGTVWRDRISSTYNGCGRLRHYANANQGGAFEDTWGAGTRDKLTSLNNQADSVSYN